MKKVNKLCSIMIIIAMVLSMAACSNENNNVDTEPDDPPPVPAPQQDEQTKRTGIDESMNGSRTLELYRILDGSTYYMKADFIGAKMSLYRDGDNLFTEVDMLGMARGDVLILDGTAYVRYDEPDPNAADPRAIKEVTEIELNKIEKLFLWFKESMMAIDGAVMIGSGNDTFQGEEDVYFEEIESGNEDKVRYFYKGNDLIGTEINGNQMDLVISGVLPEGILSVPEDFVADEDADFDELFNKVFLD